MNWELITFVGYFVILMGVALIFYFNGANKDQEDFFLGGREMGPWVTALSAQASDMSAWLVPFWHLVSVRCGLESVWHWELQRTGYSVRRD